MQFILSNTDKNNNKAFLLQPRDNLDEDTSLEVKNLKEIFTKCVVKGQLGENRGKVISFGLYGVQLWRFCSGAEIILNDDKFSGYYKCLVNEVPMYPNPCFH